MKTPRELVTAGITSVATRLAWLEKLFIAHGLQCEQALDETQYEWAMIVECEEDPESYIIVGTETRASEIIVHIIFSLRIKILSTETIPKYKIHLELTGEANAPSCTVNELEEPDNGATSIYGAFSIDRTIHHLPNLTLELQLTKDTDQLLGCLVQGFAVAVTKQRSPLPGNLPKLC